MSAQITPTTRRGSIGRLVAATVAFVILVASGYAWAEFRTFTDGVPTGSAVPALVGHDSRAGATRAEQNALHTGHDTTTVNTDTMMILHIPQAGGRPSIISFPRDSWVSIPGYGKGKLNSAYSDGYSRAKSRHESEQDAQGAGIL